MRARIWGKMETVARRQNRVFNLLQQGKSKSYIMQRLRVPANTLYRDIATLRESVKAEHYFIPPKWAGKWSAAKGKKMMNFIEFAKKVVQGEAVIEYKKGGRPPPSDSPEETQENKCNAEKKPAQKRCKNCKGYWS